MTQHYIFNPEYDIKHDDVDETEHGWFAMTINERKRRMSSIVPQIAKMKLSHKISRKESTNKISDDVMTLVKERLKISAKLSNAVS